MEPRRVLFLCTHNSARSQMAEAMLNESGGGAFAAFSAGTEATSVRPETVSVMAEVGISMAGHRSKRVDEFVDQRFDTVITVCDEAREACPIPPRAARVAHWSIPDPSAVEGSERLAAFRSARDAIALHIRRLIASGDPD